MKKDNKKALYESIMLTLKFLDGTIKSTDPKEIQVKVNETVKVCMDTLKKFRKYVDKTTEQALHDLLARKRL